MNKVLFLVVLFSGLVCVEGREFRANPLEAEKLFMDPEILVDCKFKCRIFPGTTGFMLPSPE